MFKGLRQVTNGYAPPPWGGGCEYTACDGFVFPRLAWRQDEPHAWASIRLLRRHWIYTHRAWFLEGFGFQSELGLGFGSGLGLGIGVGLRERVGLASEYGLGLPAAGLPVSNRGLVSTRDCRPVSSASCRPSCPDLECRVFHLDVHSRRRKHSWRSTRSIGTSGRRSRSRFRVAAIMISRITGECPATDLEKEQEIARERRCVSVLGDRGGCG